MKKCSFEGCTNNQFGGGFCLRHQHRRTYKPKQVQNKPVKARSPIRRYRIPTSNEHGLKTHKKALVESFGFTTQKQMFDFVWETREHKCALSDQDLDRVPQWQWHWCFAHILNKKNYQFFKLNPYNILLLHPDVHYCVDNFTEDMRKKYIYDFDKWFFLVNFMKQNYLEFLKENMI